MADQKIYIGSVGPFLFNDEDMINDPDGDFPNHEQHGIATTGKIVSKGGLAGASIGLYDTDQSNLLSLKWNENDSSDRVLNFLVSGGSRSLTISANTALNQNLLTTSSPTFQALTLSGLTASRLLSTNSSKQLTTVNLSSWISGTSNRISVSDDGSGGVVLNTPQDTHTGASPTFSALSLGTGTLTVGTINRTSGTLVLSIGGSTKGSITSSYVSFSNNVFINDIANSLMTQGLTINQGSNDDEILALKSSDVSHPFTTIAEDDTYGHFTKASASGGGLRIRGLTDTDFVALNLQGWVGSTSTTYPAVRINGLKYAGGTSYQPVSSTEQVLSVISDSEADLFTVYGRGNITCRGNLTLNSDFENVTSTITFGRTTGGNGTISYDGTGILVDKPVAVNTTSFVGSEKLRVNGNIHADGDLTLHNSGDSISKSLILSSTSGNRSIRQSSLNLQFINSSGTVITHDFNNDGDITAQGLITGYNGFRSFKYSDGAIGYFGRLGGSNNPTIYINAYDSINRAQIQVDGGTGFDLKVGGDDVIKTYSSQSVAILWPLSINATTLVGTEKLRVNGDIFSDGNLTLQNNVNTQSKALILSSTSGLRYIDQNALGIRFVDSSGNYIRQYFDDDGNVWVAGNVSADSFTDRTPWYEGDALAEIMKIRGKDGQIDHNTLPAFAQVVEEKLFINDNKEPMIKSNIIGRNLGNMISILTVAIQQLYNEIQMLKC